MRNTVNTQIIIPTNGFANAVYPPNTRPNKLGNDANITIQTAIIYINTFIKNITKPIRNGLNLNINKMPLYSPTYA